jgi:glycosyltransferase involved in cell wall biosynthesis
MRILWIPHTSWHIPQRAHLFCRVLAERHEVHVTEWAADFTSLRDYVSLRYIQNFTYASYRDKKLTVHRIPRFSPALYVPVLRRINTAIFSRIAQRIINRYKIDVVVGTFPLPPPKAQRLIFDLFDDNVAYWRSFGRAPGYAEEIAQSEASYLQRADAVVAASSVLMDKARLMGAQGPIYHIPNGVDLCLFQNVDGNSIRKELGVSGKLVGSVANYDKPAELDKVIAVAKAFARRDVIFLIAGRGTAIEPAKQRAKREGLTNLIFRGYVSPEEAPTLVSAFDVGLCCYTKSLMDDARSPMRLLMYAAAGLPTVCTNLEEVRRMRFPNVVLVEDDAQSLLEGVERALQLPHGRPPQIEMYDLHNLTKQYEEILQGS